MKVTNRRLSIMKIMVLLWNTSVEKKIVALPIFIFFFLFLGLLFFLWPSYFFGTMLYSMMIVDTRTRHVYPLRWGWCTAAHVEGDPTDSAVRKTVDGRFCRPENPTPPGGTPSGSVAAMGCPRSIRSPLEPRDLQLSNTKNSEEWGRKTVER